MHCTFGAFGNQDSFEIAASVVYKNKRFIIDAEELFNITFDSTIKYHKNVLKQVTKKQYAENIRYINYNFYEDKDSVDEPVYKYYPSLTTKIAPRSLNELPEVEELSEHFFNSLTEAEELGIISTNKFSDYLQEYDEKLNTLNRDNSIDNSYKFTLLKGLCIGIINEVELNVKRHEI